MTNAIITLQTIDAEPRVLDTLLGEAIGLAQPLNIRAVIEKNRDELEALGGIHAVRENPGAKGGRPSTAYYLTEEQALLIVTLSRTEAGRKLRAELIRVFTAWRRGNLAPATPNFGNPAEAARAWALEYERRAALEKANAEMAPKAAIADKVVRSERSIREVCRKLPGVNTNAVPGALSDLGYLTKMRPYAPRSQHRDVLFGANFDAYGRTAITVLPAGYDLLCRLYGEGKLPMKVGFVPTPAQVG